MTTLHPSHDDIVIRRAYPDDQAVLARLTSLDSAPPIAGPALVAEQGGELRAALDLERGEIVADPFRPTAHLAETAPHAGEPPRAGSAALAAQPAHPPARGAQTDDAARPPGRLGVHPPRHRGERRGGGRANGARGRLRPPHALSGRGRSAGWSGRGSAGRRSPSPSRPRTGRERLREHQVAADRVVGGRRAPVARDDQDPAGEVRVAARRVAGDRVRPHRHVRRPESPTNGCRACACPRRRTQRARTRRCRGPRCP